MRICFLGTRGLPPRYGGFETAAEEIGRRLVQRGHTVMVYSRPTTGSPRSGRPRAHEGIDLVHLPTVRLKAAETLVHTGLSTLHLQLRPCDVAIVFNAANAPFLPLLRARGIPCALHVDGLESRRSKWGRVGRGYYLMAESLGVRWADALIADAFGIQHYYHRMYAAETVYLPYGATLLEEPGDAALAALGLRRQGYHLVVARLEPENHVDLVVKGYLASAARLPLVVVGSAPYAARHVGDIEALAARAPERIRLLGSVWDQSLLNQLYAHASTYVHGHSVGGTNPSLLRAMGAGAPVLAYDVVFNREVLGPSGRYFPDASGVGELVERAERDPAGEQARGRAGRARVAERYDWEDVVLGYERLCAALAARDPAAVLEASPQRAWVWAS
ncbi:MAG: DUF1972 domain-containing protein [Acidimicrobiales bacterium]